MYSTSGGGNRTAHPVSSAFSLEESAEHADTAKLPITPPEHGGGERGAGDGAEDIRLQVVTVQQIGELEGEAVVSGTKAGESIDQIHQHGVAVAPLHGSLVVTEIAAPADPPGKQQIVTCGDTPIETEARQPAWPPIHRLLPLVKHRNPTAVGADNGVPQGLEVLVFSPAGKGDGAGQRKSLGQRGGAAQLNTMHFAAGGQGEAAVGVFGTVIGKLAVEQGQLQLATGDGVPGKLEAGGLDGLGLKLKVVEELAGVRTAEGIAVRGLESQGFGEGPVETQAVTGGGAVLAVIVQAESGPGAGLPPLVAELAKDGCQLIAEICLLDAGHEEGFRGGEEIGQKAVPHHGAVHRVLAQGGSQGEQAAGKQPTIPEQLNVADPVALPPLDVGVEHLIVDLLQEAGQGVVRWTDHLAGRGLEQVDRRLFLAGPADVAGAVLHGVTPGEVGPAAGDMQPVAVVHGGDRLAGIGRIHGVGHGVAAGLLGHEVIGMKTVATAGDGQKGVGLPALEAPREAGPGQGIGPGGEFGGEPRPLSATERDDIHQAGKGVRPPKNRAGTTNDLHPIDAEQGNLLVQRSKTLGDVGGDGHPVVEEKHGVAQAAEIGGRTPTGGGHEEAGLAGEQFGQGLVAVGFDLLAAHHGDHGRRLQRGLLLAGGHGQHRRGLANEHQHGVVGRVGFGGAGGRRRSRDNGEKQGQKDAGTYWQAVHLITF